MILFIRTSFSFIKALIEGSNLSRTGSRIIKNASSFRNIYREFKMFKPSLSILEPTCNILDPITSQQYRGLTRGWNWNEWPSVARRWRDDSEDHASVTGMFIVEIDFPGGWVKGEVVLRPPGERFNYVWIDFRGPALRIHVANRVSAEIRIPCGLESHWTSLSHLYLLFGVKGQFKFKFRACFVVTVGYDG